MWDNKKTQLQKIKILSQVDLHPQIWGISHIILQCGPNILQIFSNSGGKCSLISVA